MNIVQQQYRTIIEDLLKVIQEQHNPFLEIKIKKIKERLHLLELQNRQNRFIDLETKQMSRLQSIPLKPKLIQNTKLRAQSTAYHQRFISLHT